MKTVFALSTAALSLLASAEATQFAFSRRRRMEGIAGVFEWAGVFNIDNQHDHTWSMQQVGGAYADQTMKIVLIPITDVNSTGLHAEETTAGSLAAGTCTTVASGGDLTVATDGSCYIMQVDNTAPDSTWKIPKSDAITGLWIGTAHVPTEFERDAHYLYHMSSGNTKVDVEPVVQEGAGGFVKVTCGSLGTYGRTVSVQLKCTDSDCGSCNDTRTFTPSTANELSCWNEYHQNADGTLEPEFIRIQCDETGANANMTIYEGDGVTGCGDDQPQDKTEFLEYSSGSCTADAHGHHTHGGAPVPSPGTQSAATSTAPQGLALATIIAAMAVAQRAM